MIDNIKNLVEHWAFDPMFEMFMAALIALIGFLISLGIRRGRRRRSLKRFLLRLARQAHLASTKSIVNAGASPQAKSSEQREYYFFLFLLERVQHRISAVNETDTDGYDNELIPIRDAALDLSRGFENTRSRSDLFHGHYNAFLDAILFVAKKTGVLRRSERKEINGLKH